MTLLQSNATIKRVTGAAAGEAYDGPAGAGPEKWAGDASAYLRERRDRAETAGGAARTVDRVLIVENALGVDWRSGDVVTIRRTGAAADETIAVRLVERRAIVDDDVDAELQTTRLTLETA